MSTVSTRFEWAANSILEAARDADRCVSEGSSACGQYLLMRGIMNESLAASNPRGTTLGVLTTVAKQFREARREAGLPEDLVLYCARHTFGTALYEAAGNLAMVMKVMGHADARTAMHYQHPTLDPIRDAIDQRNLRHNSRHSEVTVQ